MSGHGTESTAQPAVRELVASPTDRGVALTGEGGLLTALTRQVLQSALDAEMAHDLGYDRHDPVGRDSENDGWDQSVDALAPSPWLTPSTSDQRSQPPTARGLTRRRRVSLQSTIGKNSDRT